MNADKNAIKINVWINDDRLEALKKAGLAEMAKEKFAGMMLLEVTCTEEQKNSIQQQYPSAKYDSSTTHSIELLPRAAKDKIFDLAVQMRSTGPEVINKFLAKN
jgi:hypothetical protein